MIPFRSSRLARHPRQCLAESDVCSGRDRLPIALLFLTLAAASPPDLCRTGRRSEAEADQLLRELIDVIARAFATKSRGHNVDQSCFGIDRKDQSVPLTYHAEASKAHEPLAEGFPLLLGIRL